MMHNPKEDLRVSYLVASKPLVKITTNRFFVEICLTSMILSSTKLSNVVVTDVNVLGS